MRALPLVALLVAACASPSGVEGRVVLVGEAPERARHALEPEMAAIHGSDVYVDAEWLVDDAGGVQNAVVLLHPIDGPAPVEALEGALYEKVGAAYEPRVLIVPVGTTVTLRNRNSICNGFMARARRNAGFNTTIGAGTERTTLFDAPEAVRVQCDLRPYMRGAIVSVDTPHHRLTGADGSFHFDDLPPGRYRLRVWHEGVGWVRDLGEVTVTEGRRERVEVSLEPQG